MNTISYKGHYIHMRWIGIKGIAYRVQILGSKFVFREVVSLKAAQCLITKFVKTGKI